MQLTDCSSPASPASCSYSRQELPGCSGWLQWLEPSYASFAPYSVICFDWRVGIGGGFLWLFKGGDSRMGVNIGRSDMMGNFKGNVLESERLGEL